jgi:hypothetical protein
MADQPTCGQGLAAHAAIPAKLADLVDATAANLEAHLKSLDSSDPATAEEHRVYERLATQQRRIAEQLRALSDEMSAARDMPMGRHDPEALASPEAVDAFRALIAVEDDVLAVLGRYVEQHRAMLEQQV